MVTGTRIIMGMPIIVEIVDRGATDRELDALWAFFTAVEARFSTYREDSELSRINRGLLAMEDTSPEMRAMIDRAVRTGDETNGYFDAWRTGTCDLSGVVKGWAIAEAANRLHANGFHHFCVNAGGDIQTAGLNPDGMPWKIGIRNPMDVTGIVKVVHLSGEGIATSGTYERGDHIHRPHGSAIENDPVVSLTVIASDVYEADRFATAAFAMGREGIRFIGGLGKAHARQESGGVEAQGQDMRDRVDGAEWTGFEGYQIRASGIATSTPGLRRFLSPATVLR